MLFDPFEELRRMQERFNRLLEEFGKFPEIKEFRIAAPVDVIDEGDQIRVVADLPGFNKEDLEIYFEDGDLVIKAEKKEETEERKGEYLRRERRMGKIYRRIALPAGIDTNAVKAKYNNGVLEITVPKVKKDRKTVQIE